MKDREGSGSSVTEHLNGDVGHSWSELNFGRKITCLLLFTFSQSSSISYSFVLEVFLSVLELILEILAK